MWKMLQHEEPDDFVVATGETHSVQEFLVEAFNAKGLSVWDHVKTDPRLLRPAEVHVLIGDSSKAEAVLGWAPSVTFKELVHIMTNSEIREDKAQLLKVWESA